MAHNLTDSQRRGKENSIQYRKEALEQLRLEVFEAMRTAELNDFLGKYAMDLYRIRNSIEVELQSLNER